MVWVSFELLLARSSNRTSPYIVCIRKKRGTLANWYRGCTVQTNVNSIHKCILSQPPCKRSAYDAPRVSVPNAISLQLSIYARVIPFVKQP